MPLLNIKNIILTKTIIGINCPRCGGDLTPFERKAKHRLWQVLLYRPEKDKNVHWYRCMQCDGGFKMSHTYTARL
jgi:hypothetical protein